MGINKQAVSGFKLTSANVKKGKEDEKLKIVLEVSLADLGAGDKDAGSVIQALMNHMSGDTEIGLTIFID